MRWLVSKKSFSSSAASLSEGCKACICRVRRIKILHWQNSANFSLGASRGF
jgi:hypothetical protein